MFLLSAVPLEMAQAFVQRCGGSLPSLVPSSSSLDSNLDMERAGAAQPLYFREDGVICALHPALHARMLDLHSAPALPPAARGAAPAHAT